MTAAELGKLPAGSRPWRAEGAIAAPADGAAKSLICSYTVAEGERAALAGLVLNYNDAGAAGGFVNGSGDLYFELWVHPGGNSFDGFPLDGYSRVLTNLGNVAAPWPVLGGVYELQSGDMIAAYVSIDSSGTVSTGVPNYCVAMLMGWVCSQD